VLDAKAMDFKFDTHSPKDSPDMTTEKNIKTGAWSGSGVKC